MISTLKGSVPPYLGVDLTEESHEREASGRTVLHFHCVVILRKRSLSLRERLPTKDLCSLPGSTASK